MPRMKKHVEKTKPFEVVLLSTTDDGGQVPLCKWWLENGVAVCDSAGMYEMDNETGIHGLRGKQFFPRDGEAFLRALPFHYSGSRLRATVPAEN